MHVLRPCYNGINGKVEYWRFGAGLIGRGGTCAICLEVGVKNYKMTLYYDIHCTSKALGSPLIMIDRIVRIVPGRHNSGDPGRQRP